MGVVEHLPCFPVEFVAVAVVAADQHIVAAAAVVEHACDRFVAAPIAEEEACGVVTPDQHIVAAAGIIVHDIRVAGDVVV